MKAWQSLTPCVGWGGGCSLAETLASHGRRRSRSGEYGCSSGWCGKSGVVRLAVAMGTLLGPEAISMFAV